jgi:Spy/CpxP family protein refolding chaperone
MKLARLGMGAALAGFLTVAGMAFADPGHGGWGHEGWERGGMEFLHGLNLTDDQKAQIKQIHEANWAQMKPLMKQAHDLHEQEINQFLSANGVTAEQLQPLVAQEETLRNQMDALRLDTLLKLRGILTPDQIAKAATVHAQMEQLHQQERAVMGHGPDEAPAP